MFLIIFIDVLHMYDPSLVVTGKKSSMVTTYAAREG
jgi:hypothetical protein